MKILKGRVDWREDDHTERPDVLLLVDAVPAREDMRFDQRNYALNNGCHRSVFYAEDDGFCRAFSTSMGVFEEEPRSVVGRTTWRPITMHDGSRRWASTSTVAPSGFRLNDLGFGPCMPIRYTTCEHRYRQGHALTGWVLVSKLRANAHLIDVGEGYSWRPGLASAAGVVFPGGSRFSLACCAAGNEYSSTGYRSEKRIVTDRFPDGVLVEDARNAIQASLAAGHANVAKEIADRYVRYLGANATGVLLTLLSYEPAVKLPDGTFWVRP